MDSLQKKQNLLKEITKLCEILKTNNIKDFDTFFKDGETVLRESPYQWKVYEDDPYITFGGTICSNYNKKAFKFLKNSGALDVGVCWKCGDSPIKKVHQFNSDHISYFICESCYNKGRSFQKQHLGYAKGTDSSSTKCYIATVCYGDINAIQVQQFRRFRDEVMIKSYFGKVFIRLYYFLSPSIAKLLQHTPKLNALIKIYILNVILKYIENSLSNTSK